MQLHERTLCVLAAPRCCPLRAGALDRPASNHAYTPARSDLAGRFFRGQLAEDLTLPTALRELFLANNALGTLPSRINFPPTLSTLNLFTCSLTGTIPESWDLPESLVVLDMSFNSFTGTLPLWALPPRLERLSLAQNRLGGTIPLWDLSPRIRQIYIDANPLVGGSFWACARDGSRPRPLPPAPAAAPHVALPAAGLHGAWGRMVRTAWDMCPPSLALHAFRHAPPQARCPRGTTSQA